MQFAIVRLEIKAVVDLSFILTNKRLKLRHWVLVQLAYGTHV